MKLNKWVGEAVRRRVLRALAAYIAVVWLLAQGLVDLFPAFGFPENSINFFVWAAVLATPFVVMLAWKYDLTSRGLLRDQQDTPRVSQHRLVRAPGPTRQTPAAGLPGGPVQAEWTDQEGSQLSASFSESFIIGRDFQADIRLPDDRVSRRHVQVYPTKDGWHLKDLNSLNGTFIDGRRIDDEKLLSVTKLTLDKRGPAVTLLVPDQEDTLLSMEVIG